MADHCISCGAELTIIDDDLNGRKNCTCVRCRAEEKHDFDADPWALFNRCGERMDAVSDYVAEHAKYHQGSYSVVLPNGRTVKSGDTYTLMRKVADAAERAVARKKPKPSARA
jgi:hypothetical protein